MNRKGLKPALWPAGWQVIRLLAQVVLLGASQSEADGYYLKRQATPYRYRRACIPMTKIERNLSDHALRAASTKSVVIFLSTYNGARYLGEQLDSIIRQSHPYWQIAVSDDGSSDESLEILQEYQAQVGSIRFSIKAGPRQGFSANFISLVTEKSISADFYSFCDQDDIWHEDKLERAVAWLEQIPAGQPALYCGRTRLVDDHGRHLGESPLFSKRPSFSNALVQSLAGGNTMVFNDSARRLLVDAGKLSVVSHDWWIYLLVSGANGHIRYDETPSIDYRQHSGNQIGANSSVSDRVLRLRRLFAGHFKQWNDVNIESLLCCQHLLAEQHRETLLAFAMARKKSLLSRCRGILSSGVYRQTLLGNLGLIVAILLAKI